MVKVVFIKKTGTLRNSSVKLNNVNELYKKCLFSSNKNFSKRHTWTINNNKYSIFAKSSGKGGNENKYELPPPIDSELYFGTMVAVKHLDEDKHFLISGSKMESTNEYIVVISDISSLRKLEDLRKNLISDISHEIKTPVAVIRAGSETLHSGNIKDPKITSDHTKIFLYRDINKKAISCFLNWMVYYPKEQNVLNITHDNIN